MRFFALVHYFYLKEEVSLIFISYYPTYDELDHIVETYKPKQINIFVDLKNCMNGMYMDEAAKTMIIAHNNSKQPPSDIYQSWLDFITFHYKYMYSRTVDMKIFTIADTGESQYHKGIYKDYKCNRSITSYKTLSMFEKDTIKNIVKKNIEVIIKTAKQLYNNYGVYLSYCESDFCPHYYIKNYYQDPSILNIIYSTDNDMLQSLKFDNTIQFFRKNKDSKMWVTKDNWKEKIKITDDVNIPVANYEYMKSIMGDSGDDIPGIKSVGPKSAIAYVKDIDITSLESFREHIIGVSEKNSKDKKAKAILDNWSEVERNYKLVSYDALINHLNAFTLQQLEDALTTKHLDFAESVAFLKNVKERLG